MTNRNISPGGSEIVSYDDEQADGTRVIQPPPGWRQGLEQHLLRHLGDFRVYHEIVSDLIHLDLAIFEPSAERPYYTAITMGVSDAPLNVPPDLRDYRHQELMLYLPPSWDLDFEESGERSWWPFRMLKKLGRFLHQHDTFFAPGHSVTGDDADPFIAGSKLSAVMLLPPFEPDAFDTLEIAGAPCRFLWVAPITANECEYKLEHGADALMTRLRQAGISPLIDPNRASVIAEPSPSPYKKWLRRRDKISKTSTDKPSGKL